MAYLVLALGAFLSICGTASIVYGSGILFDKDWISVLVGLTALNGGIVTIALGLIIKALLDLRDNRAQPVTIPSPPSDHRSLAEPAMSPNVLPVAAPEPPPSLMTPELESGMLAAILSSHEMEAFEAPVSRDVHHPAHDHAGLDHAHDHAGLDFAPLDPASLTAHPMDLPPEEGPVHEHAETIEDDIGSASPRDAVRAPDKQRIKVTFRGQEASPPPAVHEPAVHEEADGPAMDDWLGRAFSALDEEIPPPATRRRADSEPEPDHEMAHADHAPPALSDVAHAAPEPQPQIGRATPEPAVIGRYEADGTSYVMFADGSIEAQSDAGVYRFNSMAELKAHIEGGA